MISLFARDFSIWFNFVFCQQQQKKPPKIRHCGKSAKLWKSQFQSSKLKIVLFPYFRAMVLDVGGRRHKVLNSNFNIYPNTRLGKLIQARTEDEINNLCDGYKAGDIPEFFFDRNWHSFNSILDIYRTGVLHLNTDLCALVLQKDLEYWQIDELILGNVPSNWTFFLMFQQEFFLLILKHYEWIWMTVKWCLKLLKLQT